MESLGSLFLLIIILVFSIIFMNKLFLNLRIGVLNPFYWIRDSLIKPSAKDDGMMKKTEEIKLFSKFNDGLLINGKNKRLSSKESFNHLALISRTGGGKTSAFVLPNIFKLASEKCSLVITDLSGEIFLKTSGYLKSRGFNIYVLDPDKLDESIRYNPLVYANDSMSIDSLSEVLISSSGINSKADDKIWNDGAKNIISIFIKALKDTSDSKYINLANVKYLLNCFGSDGRALDEFMKRYTDNKTFNEYKGFINGNEKMVQSIISTASIALSAIGINDNLEKLTYSNNFDFKALRDKKSVVYIRIKETRQEQYSFLLNLFYTQLFSQMMINLPKDKDLPIYCLLDEFGNMNIPKFSSIITTIRKYKVSISIILQSINQLDEVYSPNKAKTILDGGIATKLIYSGADLELASKLEKMFGSKKKLEETAEGNYTYENVSVMDASEIRTIRDEEALFVYSNKKPLKLSIKPYYKDLMYKSYARMSPCKIKSNDEIDYIEYVDLENIEW